MTTQKLITDTDPERFEKRVTELTEKGWFILTESLVVKVGRGKNNPYPVWAVVLYKQ